MDSLSSRLAKIRKNAELPALFVPPVLTGLTVEEGVKKEHEAMITVCNTSDIISTDSSEYETPLWVLLMIYEKAHRACGIDYNKGLTVLIKWLSPIATPKETTIKYPNLLGGWDTTKLATLLDTTTDVINECLLNEVMPRL